MAVGNDCEITSGHVFGEEIYTPVFGCSSFVAERMINGIENVSLGSVLVPPEKCFLERFVARYIDEVPQLLSVYQGRVEVQDV
ncbi:hypothetical protein C1H46_038441 [Malus baccata]|uniref:Uncharacterized protein n=1 Tax=Malus baccata TaxID=106549 RepID=A0A540KP66_MALBA|nr:hypothetical protein C1H46_038441 [Malus baccata]